MRSLLFGTFFALLSIAPGRAELKRYLYMSTPDASQPGGSGNGILVFDIDQGHKLVRRIYIPFKEGLRGLCGNLKTRALYYSTTARRLGAFDLETEKVLWEKQYDMGCDRACITPDGSKLYVPTGWWYKGTNSGFLVVDPKDGAITQRIIAGPQAHNSIASLDGQFVYLGTETNFWVYRAKDGSLLKNVSGVGEDQVFPFTVDSRNRYAYLCLYKHVGFDLVDLHSGESIYRVFAHDDSQPDVTIPHRAHGAALTPDETELWISDQQGKKLFVFDATQRPPRQTGQIALSQAGHGWVTFSLDGHYAWCHTPDVIDARSKKVIATLKDEQGNPFCSSKFIEVQFEEGKVVAMGDQFGLGRGGAPKNGR
jgi:hypothetical protein